MRRPRFKILIIEYIDEIKPLTRAEMIARTIEKRAEIAALVREKKYEGVNTTAFREALILYRDIRILDFFLQNEAPPEDAHPKSVYRLRWLAEVLVSRGEMSSEVLSYFPKD
jgi:hypothetical protein